MNDGTPAASQGRAPNLHIIGKLIAASPERAAVWEPLTLPPGAMIRTLYSLWLYATLHPQAVDAHIKAYRSVY